ncbi:MAG: PHA/PHB synthase family protein [Microbacterium sp.]
MAREQASNQPQSKRDDTVVTFPTADGHPSVSGIALDLLLAEAGSSVRGRLLPGRATIKLTASLARHPGRVIRRTTSFGQDLGSILVGRSERRPDRGDRRFSDAVWSESPLRRRLLQSYLLLGETADGVVHDAELGWEDDQKLRFIIANLIDALSPTNNVVTNPEVLRAAIDTRGANFVRGARNAARDLREPPRLPANVDKSKFTVGENLGLSPGAVVLRDERFELIQYQPTTARVRQTPLLIVPPMINKFYIVDLAPGKSLIEYLVGRGQQVFVISWRNPCKEQREWGLDTYASAVVAALDRVLAITRADSAHVHGNCAGGMLASTTTAHLAHVGELARVASLTLGVCVIDNEHSNVVNAFISPDSVKVATAVSARKGYLDGADLAGVFLWLRPNDLIWPYMVNNWLLGKDPPAFDILYWNADTTRMPAALHRDFLTIAAENLVPQPGGLTLLGSPVALSSITVDSYLVAGISDHITPWQNCYRTTQLLGGTSRFVLSTSGHIAAIVNPPGNRKSSFHTAGELTPRDPEAWLEAATRHEGSWWSDWDAWLDERSGGMRTAPKRLGSRTHAALDPAPGTYVHA